MAKTFTSDILRLFRAEDLACMTPRGVELGNPDWMCDPAPRNGFEDHGNARTVFSALSLGSMPPDGAWAQSQLDTYAEWMRSGFLK